MRSSFNPTSPALPDIRLQTAASRHTGAIQSRALNASSAAQNPSTNHLKNFASAAATNLKANALLNSDDTATPIQKKNPGAILKAIDDNIEATAADWGMAKHEVERMLGSSKKFNEPVCGVSANNIMKLFLDSDSHSYDFANSRSLSMDELHQRLDNLPPDKNFILRVNDGVMGHAYVVDLPASNKPNRDAFLYQSDLGDGATRTLSLNDWMSKRADHPVPLSEIRSHFYNMASGTVDAEQLANLFDIDKNPGVIRTERLNLSKASDFNLQLKDYELSNLESNMAHIQSAIS